MANTVAQQVLRIDSTGGAFNATRSVKISALQIAPSNTTWAVKLTDGAGNTIISLNQDSPTPVLTPKNFTGIKVTTLTNITEVLIWIN